MTPQLDPDIDPIPRYEVIINRLRIPIYACVDEALCNKRWRENTYQPTGVRLLGSTTRACWSPQQFYEYLMDQIFTEGTIEQRVNKAFRTIDLLELGGEYGWTAIRPPVTQHSTFRKNSL